MTQKGKDIVMYVNIIVGVLMIVSFFATRSEVFASRFKDKADLTYVQEQDNKLQDNINEVKDDLDMQYKYIKDQLDIVVMWVESKE